MIEVSDGRVPYVAAWSGERRLAARVVRSPCGNGIGYWDETLVDRDTKGVLWARVESRPGAGRPLFGEVHSLRQRRVMKRLLCQVCAGLPDRGPDGVLWVMPDFRGDWPRWPDGMATYDAPVCMPCARTAARLCPGLRGGLVHVRSRSHPIVGVRGVRYRPTPTGPVAIGNAVVAHDDPAIRWTVAHQLVRQLNQCRVVEPITR
ncbi:MULTISPECIES: hypothetical protein [Actinokineospora]|uniref:Uncharacterized protein n=1 Tax=Actinokineospora fastidiosa TaxID=1816 RepID=A0A918LHP7_9PSEU|nr:MULTISPECIES: hypothetical protein [Actinokineospora]UVS81277.1 hypothetical protein Actkin_05034 [Actinokineospora sp. UTMC 2448]GGS52598.1 hypothetical protein GCM10010171_54590 [Actinokineospora fastidiosa]